MNFERFTERARQIITLAQAEAWKSGNYATGTPHLLLGMLYEDGGLAGLVLRDEFGIPAKDARALIKPGDQKTLGVVPFEAKAQKVLELSLRAALSLGHNYVGTEHILLGLLQEPGEIQELLEQYCGGPRWSETIKLEVEERIRGPRINIEEEIEKEEVQPSLELQDIIHDLLTGFKLWHDHKVSGATLDDDDEALVRWVEVSAASKYL